VADRCSVSVLIPILADDAVCAHPGVAVLRVTVLRVTVLRVTVLRVTVLRVTGSAPQPS
jgi:hypothetical protein